MNQLKIKKITPLLLLLVFSISSCRAITGIFKAGVWVGVIGIVIILAIILSLIKKLKK